jgi:hypothetical protein
LEADNPEAVKAAIDSGLPEIVSLMKPIFYQDNANTFFIQPDVTERTIEEWQEWVTRTPQVKPALMKPDWLEGIVVSPYVPIGESIPEHIDPSFVPSVSSDSIIKVKPYRDWLVNPHTGLSFKGNVIGPGGRTNLGMRLANEVVNSIIEGGNV